MDSKFKRFVGAIILAALLALPPPANAVEGDQALTVTATSAMTTPNPYADSAAMLYSIWCQVYGCLGIYDWSKKQYVGMLADKWEVIDPTTWRFHLRSDLRRQDGGPPPSSADAIHSWQRIMTDPESAQRYHFDTVKDITAVDDHTFDIHTKTPDATLISSLFDEWAITSAELYQQYGKDADRLHPFGWGPYKLDQYAIDQRIVLRRNDDYPGLDPRTPKLGIYQRMLEPDQRVTALLNGEVQIARQIPPQLMGRIAHQPGIRITKSSSIELMFLAFNTAFKPWDDLRVRQAAAHAIDRDLIIKRLLNGLADRLDVPLGPNQICYEGPIQDAYHYDPALSRALLDEAGYKGGGPEIDFSVPNGRYISDVEIGQAVAQMLGKVGFKVHFSAPEWANQWADLRAGKKPAYYMGRGDVIDPNDALTQYFETGVTPRTHYSNAKLDALLDQQRQEFDPEKRCQELHQAAELMVEQVPAVFMWTHTLVDGQSAAITYQPDPNDQVWLPDVRM
jgi:peptide/nickel transport system substrate-binding protein